MLYLTYMKNVPFFANTADDTHCVQASFRIMLKYFMPEREFSYDQLDEMSQKRTGKGTWWLPLLLELNRLEIAVKNIGRFDYKQFYRDGETYVRRIYPKETADYHLNRTNLNAIKPYIPEFLKNIEFESRPAVPSDIDKLLAQGWLVALALNSRTLNNQPGFVGHVVVVFKANDKYVWLHDPGLPPKPNRKISRQKLAESWYWSGQDNAALIALKLREN